MKILLCIVLLLVVLTLFAVWPGKRRDALRAPFLGRNCAHRGFFGKDQRPPENSLPAFAAAAKNGYGIELDVQFTADRRLVVFHDDTLDRMTPAKGFVHDMPWEEFSAQPLAGSDEHPPLFADMLRTVAEANPDTPLIVEIKSRSEYKHTYLEELCRATIAELKTYPGPYCIESFDPRVVGIVRQGGPRSGCAVSWPTATGATARPVHIPCPRSCSPTAWATFWGGLILSPGAPKSATGPCASARAWVP